MSAAKRKLRPGEREEPGAQAEPGTEQAEEEPKAEEQQEPEPIDADTVRALKEADPFTRKAALLRLQRTHGNTVIQRLMREMSSTEASREGRIQQIGNRAEEGVASGMLMKSVLYRSEMEAEVEEAPLHAKSEREIVQDDINTIGQIFANYQAALHLFEATIGADAASESVPRAAVQDFIDDFTSRVFGDLLEVDLDAIPGLADGIDQAAGVAEEPADELKPTRDVGEPTLSLRNLAIAERERVAAEHAKIVKGQSGMMKNATDVLSTLDPETRHEQREELERISAAVNRMESSSHSADWLYRELLDAWKDELRDTSVLELELDERWNVKRAHIKGRDGRKLAQQLLGDNSGNFDLNGLRLFRRLLIKPAEMAEIRIEMDPAGKIRSIQRNEKAGQYVEEVRIRLQNEGLPSTRSLTGD